KALGATERIIKILDMDDEPNAGTLSEDTVNFNSFEFENLSLGYIEDTPVLENISFRSETNQKVGCVGSSGSGKSTIFSLIERYYEIDTDHILIDGSDITDIPLYNLRKNIGYVAQESAIVSGTIRDNITYGLNAGEYTEEGIRHAIESSYA